MIRKIVTVLILIPLGIVLVVLSVANRQPTTLRLDPFNDLDPAVSVTLPLFVMLILAVLTGMIVGAVAVWFSQGRHRRALKRQQTEARRWQGEAETQKKRADALAAEAANVSVAQTGANLPARFPVKAA
ncbi:MAG: LapA family protein [Nitratireductor sp.]